MKITNDKLFLLYETLNNVKDIISCSAKVGYKLVRNIQLIKPVYDAVLSARRSTIKKYMVDGEVPEHLIQQANEELYEMAIMENELDLFVINIDDIAECNLILEDIEALMPILRDGD